MQPLELKKTSFPHYVSGFTCLVCRNYFSDSANQHIKTEYAVERAEMFYSARSKDKTQPK